MPSWLQQAIVLGVASLVVGALTAMLRSWMKDIKECLQHLDGCLDTFRDSMGKRISELDKLTEWRSHKDAGDKEWRQEWQRHLDRLDRDSETDVKRRHDLDGKMTPLPLKIATLERICDRLVHQIETLERERDKRGG